MSEVQDPKRGFFQPISFQILFTGDIYQTYYAPGTFPLNLLLKGTQWFCEVQQGKNLPYTPGESTELEFRLKFN